jgi:predicted metal-dependent phosphoesterase TrpH
MPAGQPFTELCQTLARPCYLGRVDLHLHTTFSDGTYTPAEIVDLARRSGLSAIAITDHDTLAGIAPTRLAAGTSLDVVSGVEITAEFRGRELHLLGYCFDLDNSALQGALERLQADRALRFHEMIKRLHTLGVHIGEAEVARVVGWWGDQNKNDTTPRRPIWGGGVVAWVVAWSRHHPTTATTLGRRHLAEILVRAKKAATVREAFQRYLGDHSRATVPKARLPVAEAIALVRGATGVAAWAHPNYDCSREMLLELKGLGLGAVEAEYPAFCPSRVKRLRGWAKELSLAVTGGSDCHGPGQPHRSVGARSITHEELMQLRELR